MRISLTSLRRHHWLATLAVLAFALRALVPTGFMPGGTGALTLQICPDGFPQALLSDSATHSAHAAHHHHHDGGGTTPDQPAPEQSAPDQPAHDHQSWSTHHCVFSAVATAPPLTPSLVVAAVAESAAPRAHLHAAPAPFDIRFRIAQPRGPPSLA
jgi:hypothetical protein